MMLLYLVHYEQGLIVYYTFLLLKNISFVQIHISRLKVLQNHVRYHLTSHKVETHCRCKTTSPLTVSVEFTSTSVPLMNSIFVIAKLLSVCSFYYLLFMLPLQRRFY